MAVAAYSSLRDGKKKRPGYQPGLRKLHISKSRGHQCRTCGTVRTHTSKHSAVRCYSFIGCKATGLYNRHEAETVLQTCGRGGIFGLVKHSVPAGRDVVVNVGTTWLPLDLWLLDHRSKQR